MELDPARSPPMRILLALMLAMSLVLVGGTMIKLVGHLPVAHADGDDEKDDGVDDVGLADDEAGVDPGTGSSNTGTTGEQGPGTDAYGADGPATGTGTESSTSTGGGSPDGQTAGNSSSTASGSTVDAGFEGPDIGAVGVQGEPNGSPLTQDAEPQNPAADAAAAAADAQAAAEAAAAAAAQAAEAAAKGGPGAADLANAAA